MKKTVTETKTKKALVLAKDVFLWILGSLCYAVGVACFVNPLKFSTGGVTGIGIIINYILPVVPIGAMMYVINIPLFIISWKVFGFRFIARTMAATAVLTSLIDITGVLAQKYSWIYTGDEKLLGAIFGGILMGAGLGLVFVGGATTGGIDILARLLRLKFPHLSMGKLILLCDLVVVGATAVVYKDILSILYSLIVVYLSSTAVDYVVSGRSNSKMLMIMTEFPEEVTADITGELHRGVSVINAKGGYTGEDRKMLLCVVRVHEVAAVRKIIGRYDEKPFIIITDSSEVLGEGFKAHNDTL